MFGCKTGPTSLLLHSTDKRTILFNNNFTNLNFFDFLKVSLMYVTALSRDEQLVVQ